MSISALTDLVAGGGVLVLSGAGLSTDSGIPDYRGPDGTRRIMPMTIAQFCADPADRRRYWARAHAGWRRFSAAWPNDGHRVVASLEHGGFVGDVITQNVDGLHRVAGSRRVLDLHGSLARVRCLACGLLFRRQAVEATMAAANPEFCAAGDAPIRPDGDVLLDDAQVARFIPPRCVACGADVLKPDVVFFGESVPRPTVDRCFAAVEAARCLLVLGSSLQVMSGLRFVRRAAALGRPVAILTRGQTRAEDLATVRIDADLTPTLAALRANLAVAAAAS